MVGRKPTVLEEPFVKACIEHKDEILKEDRVIASKNSEIWRVIADELNVDVKPTTLYTKVCVNAFKVLDKLRGIEELSFITSRNTTINDDSEEDMDEETDTIAFEIILEREIFKQISTTVKKKNKRACAKNVYTRTWTKFKQGAWQHVITEKVWEESRYKCPILFKNYYLSENAVEGTINGYCRCGSQFKGILQSDGINDIIIKCQIIPGYKSTRCGKAYVRKPQRLKIAKDLQAEKVMKGR